jgi:hypothetical protein
MKIPFNPASIRIDRPPMSIYQMMDKINRKRITLDPDFQRNLVWDEVRKSRLIESILLRLPLPTFYVDATGDYWQVIDGLQRLTTLEAFINQQTLRLSGLEVLIELNGKVYNDLTDIQQETINDTPLTIISIEPGTPRDVKFMIFRRINTGGINLNDQEIRHAIYGNPARDFLRDLAESPEFLTATSRLVDSRRMEDRECVLRFMAFRLNPYDTVLELGSAAPTFGDLLNVTMNDLNNISAIAREQYAEEFRSSMRLAYELFGELAFREVQEQRETGPFRAALFEIWSVLLPQHDHIAAFLPQVRESIIAQSIATMTNNAAFLASIQPGSDDRQSILTRFGTINALLRSPG